MKCDLFTESHRILLFTDEWKKYYSRNVITYIVLYDIAGGPCVIPHRNLDNTRERGDDDDDKRRMDKRIKRITRRGGVVGRRAAEVKRNLDPHGFLLLKTGVNTQTPAENIILCGFPAGKRFVRH